MKKLSEILGLDKLSMNHLETFDEHDSGRARGRENVLDALDQFEIDYEYLAKEITYSRYGSVWVDLPTSKKSEYIEITKKIISPEKLFKKKVG